MAGHILLQSEGFDVVGESADGEGALEAVDRLRPDVVLVDIQDRVRAAGPRRFLTKRELSGARLAALLV